MNHDVRLNEKAIIERALSRMRSHEPGIPAEKVKIFLAKIGEEIEPRGELTKESVDELLRQLKNGQLLS